MYEPRQGVSESEPPFASCGAAEKTVRFGRPEPEAERKPHPRAPLSAF